eukprot:869299-Amorphochlora_amoeboformis.AAC.1
MATRSPEKDWNANVSIASHSQAKSKDHGASAWGVDRPSFRVSIGYRRRPTSSANCATLGHFSMEREI